MQIKEAIDQLKAAVGIACDAGMQAGEAPKRGGDGMSSIGDDIVDSIVEFKPSVVAAERSIQSIRPGEVPQEVVDGGEIVVRFKGNQQPEAARTLDSILTPILNDVLQKEEGQYRCKVGHGVTDKRVIPFPIPDEVAGDFVGQLIAVTHIIKSNTQLRKQFQMGTELSIEYLNKIDGVKPYVMLQLDHGLDMQGSRVGKKPPHFVLVMKGVPVPLAKGLAEILGKNVDDLKTTRSTTNRDQSRRFTGGKELDIALDDPLLPKVVEKIKQYVTLMNQFKPGGGALPPVGGG